MPRGTSLCDSCATLPRLRGTQVELHAAAPTYARFGELLREARTDAGLTQADLAERAGLSSRTIQHLESGLGHPFAHSAQKLADALHLTGAPRAEFLGAARRAPRTRVTP